MLPLSFPSPNNATALVHSDEVSVEEAILQAAIHCLYEGHIQGEDERPRCELVSPCDGGGG